MTRFILQRLALAAITLFLLSVIVFAAVNVLPGDVARTILGPTADPQSVAVLNARLGLDRPIVEQYLDWITGIFQGDFGTSYLRQEPIGPILLEALGKSIKLAAVAFLLVVPTSIAAGVVAALFAQRWPDRWITGVGLAVMVVPEFVTGIVLLVLFAVTIPIFPVSANAPPGSDPFTQLWYLVLPAIPVALVIFGYIARITRAGTLESLESDYTRTAVLKGLPGTTVLRRHVLRNALLPTITVVATQTGYLIGGLVVVEILFNYQGVGLLIFQAAQGKDFPMLEAGVLTIGMGYLVLTLFADLLYSVLNPRIRYASA
jgi:peptide/nickel transport system permease protein